MSEIHNIHNEDEWNEFIQSHPNKLIVAQIGAKWCKPCKEIKPHVEVLAKSRPDIVFVYIDTDEAEENFFEFGMADQVPTFRLVKDCVKVVQFADSNLSTLLEAIEKYI